MTDRQAKVVCIEAAFRSALNYPRFPHPHGVADIEDVFMEIARVIDAGYRDRMDRMLVEALINEFERTKKRANIISVFKQLAVIAVALTWLAWLLFGK